MRKTKAIFLLLMFVAVQLHSMVPHFHHQHHAEPTLFSTDASAQTCSAHSHTEIEDTHHCCHSHDRSPFSKHCQISHDTTPIRSNINLNHLLQIQLFANIFTAIGGSLEINGTPAPPIEVRKQIGTTEVGLLQQIQFRGPPTMA